MWIYLENISGKCICGGSVSRVGKVRIVVHNTVISLESPLGL